MGYEDGMVDKLKKNYHNVRRPKVKISNNYHKVHNNFNSLEYNKKASSTKNHQKSNQKHKKKKKFKCRKKFKFSKYHQMSKRALYDYQFEECRIGLKNDAKMQMNNIFNLIKNDADKRVIKCKVEEINEFIEHHKLLDHDVQRKRKQMMEKYRQNSK